MSQHQGDPAQIWAKGITQLLEPFGFERQGDRLIGKSGREIELQRFPQQDEIGILLKATDKSGQSRLTDLGTLAKGVQHRWNYRNYTSKVIIEDITTAILEYGLAWLQDPA